MCSSYDRFEESTFWHFPHRQRCRFCAWVAFPNCWWYTRLLIMKLGQMSNCNCRKTRTKTCQNCTKNRSAFLQAFFAEALRWVDKKSIHLCFHSKSFRSHIPIFSDEKVQAVFANKREHNQNHVWFDQRFRKCVSFFGCQKQLIFGTPV